MFDDILASRGSFKVSFDEKKNDIVAKLEYHKKKNGDDISRNASASAEGLVAVNALLRELLNLNTLPLSELVASGRVQLVKDAALRYEFDFTNNLIVERRLRRSERRVLDGKTEEETKEPVVEEVKTTKKDEKKEEPVLDYSVSKDFDAVVKEIIRLNPDVEIKVEKEGVENRRIFASVKGEELKLPNGLLYNSTLGILGKYLIIKVEDLEKAKETVVEEPKEEAEVEVAEEVKKEKTSLREKVRNLKFVNWKTLKVILATGLVVWGITALTSHRGNSNSNDTSRSNDNHNNDDGYGSYDDGSVDTTFNTTDEDAFRYAETVYEQAPVYDTEDRVYNEVNNDTYETTYLSGDIDDQMNEIAGICYQNISDIYNFLYYNQGHLDENINACDFTSIVPNNDRDAVAIINNARNYVVRNAYTDSNTILTKSDVYSFLLDYVNYAFEGGTVFDGQPIKSYNYLDPYSRYVVTVVGETMLQLYPDFNYESPYSNYSYQDLLRLVTDEHTDLANTLANGYGRRY